MPDSAEEKTQLKKRARRRLMGSVALAGLVAVVLPMIMNDEPEPPASARIIIPGEDSPFRPRSANPRNTENSTSPTQSAPSADHSAASVPAQTGSASLSTAKPPEKRDDAAKPAEKKPAEKPAGKPQAKPAEKPEEKLTGARLAERKRAEDILSGRFSEPSEALGRFVIRIGSFSNPTNIATLQSKLGQVGVKTFTETFDAPDGKKTRLRAGPFASKPAAEQALAKMKRIGVGGVIAPQP
jgi:DedD protein